MEWQRWRDRLRQVGQVDRRASIDTLLPLSLSGQLSVSHAAIFYVVWKEVKITVHQNPFTKEALPVILRQVKNMRIHPDKVTDNSKEIARLWFEASRDVMEMLKHCIEFLERPPFSLMSLFASYVPSANLTTMSRAAPTPPAPTHIVTPPAPTHIVTPTAPTKILTPPAPTTIAKAQPRGKLKAGVSTSRRLKHKREVKNDVDITNPRRIQLEDDSVPEESKTTSPPEVKEFPNTRKRRQETEDVVKGSKKRRRTQAEDGDDVRRVDLTCNLPIYVIDQDHNMFQIDDSVDTFVYPHFSTHQGMYFKVTYQHLCTKENRNRWILRSEVEAALCQTKSKRPAFRGQVLPIIKDRIVRGFHQLDKKWVLGDTLLMKREERKWFLKYVN